MIVLALAAHPDDVEMTCSGTLSKCKKRGDDVYIVHACVGDKGGYSTSPEKLKALREQESEASGRIIDAQVIHLGFSDAELEYSPSNLDIFIKVIRKVNPDMIITHVPDDYHIDHKAVSHLVIDASFLVTVPLVCPDVKAMSKVPQIYFMEPYTGFPFSPQEFVDITEELEDKIAMMDCHQSQVSWLKEHDQLDIQDYIITSAKYRGFQCGSKYAEAFIRYQAALRNIPARLLP